MPKKSLAIYLLSGIAIFLLSTAFSFFLTPSLSGITGNWQLSPGNPNQKLTPTPKASKKPKIDPSIPRTEVCPLNGLKYTAQEKALWETRRPLAVAIENHQEARPLSGLSSADIVYEGLTEGGITRMLGIFYCNVSENTMFAPVRSARIHFTKLILEYDALFNHVGGAGNCDDPNVTDKVKALCFIRTNRIKDLDQFGKAGDFRTCHRVTSRLDHEVAYEHTMACYSDELYKVAAKNEWTSVDAKGVSWDKNFKPWKFKDDASAKGSVGRIAISFWDNTPDYDVVWQYDPASNAYLRENGGQKAVDLNTEEQLSSKVVIVQFVKEDGPHGINKHYYYEIQGTGKAIVFQDGQAIQGTWSKTSLTGRTRFLDSAGKEIELNRGPAWITLLPTTSPVTY